MIVTDRAERGRLAEVDVIEYAHSLGFPLSDSDRDILATFARLEPGFLVKEAVLGPDGLLDRAHEWLNRPSTVSYGWWEGTYRSLPC